jgi:hypothetical protein
MTGMLRQCKERITWLFFRTAGRVFETAEAAACATGKYHFGQAAAFLIVKFIMPFQVRVTHFPPLDDDGTAKIQTSADVFHAFEWKL